MAIRTSDHHRLGDRAVVAAPPELSGLLRATLDGLHRLYGTHLAGAYLFGSHARGDAEPGSDVDVLVVLNELESQASEIARTSTLRADLSGRAGTTVSLVFVTAADWVSADTPFLVTARQDAIPL